MEPPSSPIDQDQVLVSDDVLLISHLVDIGTDLVPDVIRPVAPSPPLEQIFVPDWMWAPVAVPLPAIDGRRETPVPRWRLAREGPFLAQRSPESIRSLGLVAPSGIRCTTVRTMTRLWGSLDCRCIIRGSLTACLLEMGAGRWVDHLSRDGAVAAAVQLQRDVGLMQTNLDVLDQYSLVLQGTVSKLIEVCLGARPFPTEGVAAGALGPRVRRASVQMEAMGLWRPSMDPLRLH